jgi:hypothetical protein
MVFEREAAPQRQQRQRMLRFADLQPLHGSRRDIEVANELSGGQLQASGGVPCQSPGLNPCRGVPRLGGLHPVDICSQANESCGARLPKPFVARWKQRSLGEPDVLEQRPATEARQLATKRSRREARQEPQPDEILETGALPERGVGTPYAVVTWLSQHVSDQRPQV